MIGKSAADGQSRLVKILLFAALGISGILGRTAHAQVFYLGIGNEEFQGDVTSAYNTMVTYAATPASIAQYYNQTGPQITAILNNYRNSLQNGDVLIFHYSGHGGGPGIADAAPIDENNMGNNGDEGVIGMSDAGNPGAFSNANIGVRSVRDDAIAAELNNFAASVAILSIFDSCFAGELIDGTSDVSRGLVIGTTDANNCAQGTSLFMPHWNDAFTLNGAFLKADSNKNGTVTLGELYARLDDINGQINTSGGVAFATNFGESAAHMAYAVATHPVPLPAAAWLFGFGMVGLFAFSRRRG